MYILCPWHSSGVPYMSLVSQTSLRWFCNIYGIPETCLISLICMYCPWHTFGLPDIFMMSVKHMLCPGTFMISLTLLLCLCLVSGVTDISGVPNIYLVSHRDAQREKSNSTLDFCWRGGGVGGETRIQSFWGTFGKTFFQLEFGYFWGKGGGEANPNLMRNLLN